MRVTAAFSRLLRLPGVWVRGVVFDQDQVVVTVALRRRLLVCPACEFSTAARYDRRPVASAWRHLDLGACRLEIKAELRRVCCPAHGVRREAVPFARVGSYHTRDFEDLVGWLATTMDKTAVVPAGAHRLGQRRADHHPGDGRRARPRPARVPLRHRRG